MTINHPLILKTRKRRAKRININNGFDGFDGYINNNALELGHTDRTDHTDLYV